MTLFKRTEQAIEELEQVLASIAIENVTPDVKERKRQLDNASRIFDEVRPEPSSFAGLSDGERCRTACDRALRHQPCS